jgi:hypothetical protein
MRLHSVIASAKTLGYYQLECEARLALAEAEIEMKIASAASPK